MMEFMIKKKNPENPEKPEEPKDETPRCPGCPNHCPLNALKCGKGRNLLRQKELMGG